MSGEQTTSFMQRKARTGREANAARAMSLARALRVTAAKEADRTMALPLRALGVTRRSLQSQDVAESVDTPWLTMLMDGPNGQVAAVLIDPALATGLIQQQTMAKVLPAVEGEEQRRHTATDAALCAPFIETVLERAALLPEIEEERAILTGYRFGVLAQEPRHAQLALDAASYELVEMTLDLDAGKRTGKLLLILPEPVKGSHHSDEIQEDEKGQGGDRGPKLATNVMGLNAELMIALTRLKMPLNDVSALQPGDVLNLNLTSMSQALVLDGNGVALTRGTLGQIDGMRALQVEQQRSRQYTEPRRRAADREALDLPDVTAPRFEAIPDMPEDDAHVPTLSDVDIFGDVDDLPEMPDIEGAEEAADAHMAALKENHAEAIDERRERQTGW